MYSVYWLDLCSRSSDIHPPPLPPTFTKGVFSIMPKILENLVGSQMERSVSVPSDQNVLDHIYHSILTNRFIALLVVTYVGIWKRNKRMGKSHSSWLARFDRIMWFHFPWVFPLVSDQPVWHNGKHPRTLWRPLLFHLLGNT